MVGGATLTKLLGTSAWYAPGAAAAEVVEAVIHDQDAVIPVLHFSKANMARATSASACPLRAWQRRHQRESSSSTSTTRGEGPLQRRAQRLFTKLTQPSPADSNQSLINKVRQPIQADAPYYFTQTQISYISICNRS